MRYLTAGESHGNCITAILDGLPAGLKVDTRHIDRELSRRMLGYGRGKRMQIEADRVRILSGLRKGMTIGSPVALRIDNKDQSIDALPVVLEPRPGHADLAGALKYGLSDIRSILERASARETVARVGIGALARILLAEFDVRITSHVIFIGGVAARSKSLGYSQIVTAAERSAVRCADPEASKLMCKAIDNARQEGDTLGGIFEIVITGVVPGLGSHAQWDRKIDALLTRAMMSVQAVKGVSFGMGFDLAGCRGSDAHDEIFYDRKKGFHRNTNNAGGIEGGMTNGEDIIMRVAMKPISTLLEPLASVNIKTKRPIRATIQRSDVCAVPAAGVVGEAVAAIEIANAMCEKFGGDSVNEMRRNFEGYVAQVKKS